MSYMKEPEYATLLRFVHHTDRCDFVQPMWHQGPCDCGLHKALEQLTARQLAELREYIPNVIEAWEESKRRSAAWREEKRREQQALEKLEVVP